MNDEPPLQKKTIKKGHEIADKILKKENNSQHPAKEIYEQFGAGYGKLALWGVALTTAVALLTSFSSRDIFINKSLKGYRPFLNITKKTLLKSKLKNEIFDLFFIYKNKRAYQC